MAELPPPAAPPFFDRFAAASGLLAVLFFLASWVLGGFPGESLDAIQGGLFGRSTLQFSLDKLRLGGVMAALGWFFILWFVATMAGALRRLESAAAPDGTGRLSLIVLVALAAHGAIALVSVALSVGATFGGLATDPYIFYPASTLVGIVPAFPAALWTEALSVGIIRTGLADRRLGYLGLFVALGWLAGGMWLFGLLNNVLRLLFIEASILSAIWIALLSIHMWIRVGRGQTVL